MDSWVIPKFLFYEGFSLSEWIPGGSPKTSFMNGLLYQHGFLGKVFSITMDSWVISKDLFYEIIFFNFN